MKSKKANVKAVFALTYSNVLNCPVIVCLN